MTTQPPAMAELRRPFAAEAVKWRAAVKRPDRRECVAVLPYIDSFLVSERLTDVDPAWSEAYLFRAGTAGDPLGMAAYLPVECTLTVLGVTHIDVGQATSPKASDKAVKEAYSDALKRAATRFGIGSYLRALPEFHVEKGGYWMGKDRDGKDVVKGLTASGKQALRKWYTRVVTHELFASKFGEVLQYGDLGDDQDDVDTTDEPGEAQGSLDTLPSGATVIRKPGS